MTCPALWDALRERLTYFGAPLPTNPSVVLGYFPHTKTTTDIPQPTGLLANLDQARTLLGDGSVLANSNPADLLALLHSQSLVDLVLTISPVFNPAHHSNHPACRGPDQIVTTVIPFNATATYAATPSGNHNLNFSDDTFLHINANQARTSGLGSLLGDQGVWSINLSQFHGMTQDIPGDLVSGIGVAARACTTASPAQCTSVTLRRP